MIQNNSAFDIDYLVDELKTAARHTDARALIKSILIRTVENPAWVSTSIPDYTENEVILYEDDTVSIWHCRFPSGSSVPVHDHQMIATIAVYQGTEQNDMWVKSDTNVLEKKTEIRVNAGEVLQIGSDAIHSVSCNSDVDSCAIHVYLGNLTTVKRSLFDTKNQKAMQFDDDNYRHLQELL